MFTASDGDELYGLVTGGETYRLDFDAGELVLDLADVLSGGTIRY